MHRGSAAQSELNAARIMDPPTRDPDPQNTYNLNLFQMFLGTPRGGPSGFQDPNTTGLGLAYVYVFALWA